MSKKEKIELPEEEPALDPLVEELKLKNDQLLRLAAEFDNFKKRSARERDEVWVNARADLFKTLLPVMDNFERAMTDIDDKGVEMIFAQFCDVFASNDVVAFGEVGDEFDPMCHNAVMHIEDDKLGKNVIAAAYTKGYRLKDKVIREAMVSVAN